MTTERHDGPPPKPHPRKFAGMFGLPDELDIERVERFGTVYGVLLRVPRREPVHACPQCGAVAWRIQEERSKLYRTPPVAGQHVLTRVNWDVWQCRGCRASRWSSSLPTAGITPALAQLMADAAVYRTLSEVGREFCIDRTQVKGIVQPILEERVQNRALPAPRYLGIDATTKAGIKCCLLVDLERSTHIEVLKYDELAIVEYLKEMRAHWEGTLQCVVIDTDGNLKRLVREAWPGLPRVLDHYHVQQKVNSAVTRMVKAYKEKHLLKGSYFALRHPEREGYAVLVAKLRADGHGVLVDVHEHARALDAVYASADSVDALDAWLTWRDSIPSALLPFVGGTVRNLDRNWRVELCAAADFHVPSQAQVDVNGEPHMVVISNGAVENLHKRVQHITGRAPTIGFDLLRLRLLLMEGRREQDAKYRADRANIQQAQEAFRKSLKKHCPPVPMP